MAQLQSPETYVDGQQVTATRLNNQTNGATLLPGAITDQTALTANTIATGDGLIIHDASASALRKATAGDILGSGLPVVTGSVTAVAGADLVVTPAATFKLDVAGPLEADSLNITGNSTIVGNQSVTGTLTVGGLVTFNATSAVKIPVGTTAERPATSVAGQFRYNTTLDTAEVYSGTEWKAAGGLPFDATGGNTIATVDGYKIHTFTSTGTFTPGLTKEGKIEFLVVAGGGGGASANSGTTTSFTGGGGGGGGAVQYGTLFVAKNTAPMSVIVGTGGAYGGGSGTSSSFSTLTSLGGSGGSFPIGSNNAPGGQGGLPSSLVGDGGGGHRWDQNGDAGSEGFGSFISGTLVNYGGGGGGGGYSGGKGNGGGGYGGGYSSGNAYPGTAPVVSSGGGGGGGSGPSSPAAGHAGAGGVVIIRYRVS